MKNKILIGIIFIFIIFIGIAGYWLVKTKKISLSPIQNLSINNSEKNVVVEQPAKEKIVDFVDQTAYAGDSYYKISFSDQEWELGSNGGRPILKFKKNPICEIALGAGGQGMEGYQMVEKPLQYKFGPAKESVFSKNQDGAPDLVSISFPMADKYPGTSLEGISYLFNIYASGNNNFKSVDEYLECRGDFDRVLDTFVIPNASDNILISKPKIGEEATNKIKVKGYARVFEGQFNIRLKTIDGTVLVETTALASMKDLGQFSYFESNFEYSNPDKKDMALEVFDYSAKDGAEIDMVKIPLKFKS